MRPTPALAALIWGATLSCATAAPVLWSTRPAAIAPGEGLSASDDAQALDELTAPLSADQMGFGSGVDFRTTFDEDIRGLRERREQEQRDSGEIPAEAAPDPLDPRIEGPSLRYLPRLRPLPEDAAAD